MTEIALAAEFILDAFSSLGKRILPADSFDAKRIPWRSDSYVAVSSVRELVFLLEVAADSVVIERRLNAITVSASSNCAIVDSATDEVIRRRFAVIGLRPGHESLASSFAVVLAALLATLEMDPSPADVVHFIDCVVELVTPRPAPSLASVIGLWGELWLIRSAHDPVVFARAWHRSSEDLFDFSFPSARVELKTTSGRTRVHQFSLEQLEDGDAKPSWVASLAVIVDPSGDTVMDLLEQLRGLLPTELASRVSHMALSIIAGDIESVSDFRFLPFGAAPLLVFRSMDVPRVSLPPDASISSVRFNVDLGRVKAAFHSASELSVIVSGPQEDVLR